MILLALGDYVLYSAPTVNNNPTALASRNASTLTDVFKEPPFGYAGAPANADIRGDSLVYAAFLALLGLLGAQIAAAGGCNVLGIDIDPRRVQLAEQLGLKAVLRADAVDAASSFTRGRGFDVVLICADTHSDDPVELAGVIARDRARVVAAGAVGLNIPRKIYYEKELSFINSRSYGPGRYDLSYEEQGRDYPIGFVRWTEGRNLESVVELMAQDKLHVKPLISHRFPIEEAAAAYDVITGKRKEPFLGVLLTYPDGSAEPPDGAVKFNVAGRPAAAVKLGVLGAGLYANATLLPAIKDLAGIELVGIASSGGLHAEHSGKKFGFKYASSSEDPIINDPAINTVAILTRHDSHAALVVKALSAGKHVFVEKPLAIDEAQLELISAQLQRSDGCLLLVGFNRRFSPLARKLQASLVNRQEPLYAHYRVNAGYIPLNHWTQDPAVGGGRIIGEGCHFVDLITFLVGAAPISVHARALPAPRRGNDPARPAGTRTARSPHSVTRSARVYRRLYRCQTNRSANGTRPSWTGRRVIPQYHVMSAKRRIEQGKAAGNAYRSKVFLSEG